MDNSHISRHLVSYLLTIYKNGTITCEGASQRVAGDSNSGGILEGVIPTPAATSSASLELVSRTVDADGVAVHAPAD